MATHSEPTPTGVAVDVTDFAREVIEQSRQAPVLVDFWAPWCGPCRMLGPVLDKLAAEFSPAFVLAKVNTDDHQDAARQYEVRGIPAVKLFRDGRVVAEFAGALPEAQVRSFLREHFPSEAESLVQQGLASLEAADGSAAKRAFEKALSMNDGLDAARYGLARVALLERDFDAAEAHLDALSPRAPERDAGKFLLEAIELVRTVRESDSEAGARARIDADPDDVEAHFIVGGYELAAGRYRQALEAFLQVAERQRKWRDQAARKAMLTVFGILGVRHPTSDEFRQKLMFIYLI